MTLFEDFRSNSDSGIKLFLKRINVFLNKFII